MKRFSDRLVFLVLLTWTAVSFGSLAYHILDSNKHIEQIAREAAREHIEKDKLYRLWAAEHGGVYVPVTPKTRPNPYLADVRDRDVITPSGKWLTLVNPAYMTRQVHDLAVKHDGMAAHITSLNPLRPENKPDEWETGALKAIEAGREDFGEVVTIDGSSHYRLMLPLKTEEACLKCHAVQGYRLGDIRGGLSASVPMARFAAIQRSHVIDEISHFGSVWIIGIIGILIGSRYVRHRVNERDRAVTSLQESERRLLLAVESGGVGLWEWDLVSGKLHWNDRLKNIFGLSANAPGLTLEKFISAIHPDDVVETERMFRAALAGNTEFRHEYRILWPDGSIRWIEAIGRGIYDRKGKPVRMTGGALDITGRRHAEEVIRTSERKLKESHAIARLGHWEWDVRADRIVWSDEVYRIFGFDQGTDISYEILRTRIHPEDREYHDRHTAEIIRNKRGEPYEYRILLPDGSVRHIFAIVQVSTDSQNQVVRFFGTVQDVTDRKQTEEALRASEEKYRALFMDNPVPMWVFDSCSLAFLAVNDFAVDHYGYSREEFLNMTIEDIRPPEDLPNLHKTLREKAGKLRKDILSRHRKKDGSLIDVHITGHEIVFEGRPAILILAVDITEQRKAEEALRESEAHLRDAEKIGNIGNWEYDFSINKLTWSAQAYSIFGIDPADGITFEAFLSRIHPADRGRVQKSIRHAIDNRVSPWEIEYRILRDSGEERCLYEIAQMDVTGEGSPVRRGIVQDITDRKKAEEQRMKLEEQLLQAQKMEAIGILAGGIAHDFNNMLQVIIHYSSLLKTQDTDAALKEEFLEGIISTSVKAAELTQGLLAYSRKQRLNLTFVDINKIILDTEKMLRRIIGEDIVLVARLCPKALVAKVDAGQIQQVLINLATNARDSMPRGGSLTIGTDVGKVSEEFRTLRDIDMSADYAYITVTDTGEGMDEATRSRIFDPFFTTKEMGKGTGLGLAIVYGIVKQHKGFIHCWSHKGSGTTFTIELPLTRVEQADSGKKKVRAVSRGRETILLAEDEEVVRRATKLVLESAGYTVLTAADGYEAIELYRKNLTVTDLLLFDVVMPGCNGKEAYEEIRKINPDAVVCFISGYADDVINNRVNLEGNFTCIAKPISPEDLLKNIRKVLDKSAQEH